MLTATNTELKKDLQSLPSKQVIDQTESSFAPIERNESELEKRSRELGEEVEEYCEWVTRNQNSRRISFRRIFSEIRKIVHGHFNKDCKLLWTGSFAVGLDLPWSDANLELRFFRRPDPIQIETFTQKCKDMSKLFSSVLLEQKEHIMILTLSMSKEFQEQVVEIIFRQQKPRESIEKEEVITNYLIEYPLVRPLYLVIKSLLHHQYLDDPSTGGLVGFALLFMIVSFVQSFEGSQNGDLKGSAKSPENLGLGMIRSGQDLFSKNKKPLSPRRVSHAPELETEKESLFSLYRGEQTLPLKREMFLNEDRSTCRSQSNPGQRQLGEALLSFLYTFGFSFDYCRVGIRPLTFSAQQGSPFVPKTFGDRYMDSLTVIHPHSKDLIITKNFKRTSDLKSFLQKCYLAFLYECRCNSDKEVTIKKNSDTAIVFRFGRKDSELMNESKVLPESNIRNRRMLLMQLLNLSSD